MADQQTNEGTTGTHPAHFKADEISKRVPEIAALYRSIGMRSYFDDRYLSFGIDPPKGYIVRDHCPEDIQRKKEQIDEVLWELKYNEIANEPDINHFKDGAVELAQKYAQARWLHTPWLTSRILTQVLDSELVPLRKEAFGTQIPSRITSILPGLWGLLLPAALSFIYLVILSLIAFALFSNDHPISGFLVSAYIVWHFGNRLIINFRIRRERKRLAGLFGELHLIREEVASGTYDPAEVERRLRRSEEKGLYVHTLSHTLLKTGHSDR